MHPKHVCAEEKTVYGEEKIVSIDPEPLALTCKLRQKHKKPLVWYSNSAVYNTKGRLNKQPLAKMYLARMYHPKHVCTLNMYAGKRRLYAEKRRL